MTQSIIRDIRTLRADLEYFTNETRDGLDEIVLGLDDIEAGIKRVQIDINILEEAVEVLKKEADKLGTT